MALNMAQSGGAVEAQPVPQVTRALADLAKGLEAISVVLSRVESRCKRVVRNAAPAKTDTPKLPPQEVPLVGEIVVLTERARDIHDRLCELSELLEI